MMPTALTPAERTYVSDELWLIPSPKKTDWMELAKVVAWIVLTLPIAAPGTVSLSAPMSRRLRRRNLPLRDIALVAAVTGRFRGRISLTLVRFLATR
jgi:hypothetical protein